MVTSEETEYTRPATWQDVLLVTRYLNEAGVDYVGSVCGLTWDDLAQHRITKVIDGVTIPMLDLEGLLRTKQGVRPKDQMDAAILRRALDVLRASESAMRDESENLPGPH